MEFRKAVCDVSSGEDLKFLGIGKKAGCDTRGAHCVAIMGSNFCTIWQSSCHSYDISKAE